MLRMFFLFPYKWCISLLCVVDANRLGENSFQIYDFSF